MGQESFLTISSARVYDARGMGVKVAVVGGGSTYTPELVEGFVTRGDRLPVDELVLLDIDPRAPRRRRRARRAHDAPCRLVGAPHAHRRPRRGDRRRGLRDRAAAGGRADQARFRDETIPLRFGCIGQETTGPGGFAKALRTVPVVLELAELTARRGAPGRVVRGLHEPDRTGDAGAAGRGASGDRALQRGDRVPAASSRRCSTSHPSACSWTTSGSTT